ncbi:MAG: SpoIIE family protein phosphatase [Nitrospirales bacterium]
MSRPILQWGVATLTLPGEKESGDRHLVLPYENGALVAAVDGLGHGEEAAAAAELAVALLEKGRHHPLQVLLDRCHEQLKQTRGVVMSLAAFNLLEGTMSWVGVGDVLGVLVRAQPEVAPVVKNLVTQGGVVGIRLPPTNPEVLPVKRGDRLIFATDGVHQGFDADVSREEEPQQTADRILSRYKKNTDDALVLVVRYDGGDAA